MNIECVLLDTSIILDDTENLLYLHKRHKQIYITDVVLEELDRKKDSQSESGYFAREFFRRIKTCEDREIESSMIKMPLDSDKLVALMFEIKDSSIPVFVINRDVYKSSFSDYGYNDTKIREIAKDYDMLLLTNDIALRVRSIIDGILSHSLNKTHIYNPAEISFIKEGIIDRGLSNIESFEKSEEFISCSDWHVFALDECDYTDSMQYKTGKKYFGIKLNNKFHHLELDSIIKEANPYILPINIEQKLAFAMLTHKENFISIITGSTGSGKTLIALLAAIVLQKAKLVDGIIYMRNTVTANDKEAELGFRKGDEIQKLHYFMYPLFSAINFIIESLKEDSMAKRIEYKGESRGFDKQEATQYFLEKHRIEVLDIAHARGISLFNKFVIFDEVQNASDATIKLIGTRLGEGSRIVFLGDYNQIDHPYLSKYRNGAISLLNKAISDNFIFGMQLKHTIRSKSASWFDEEF